MCEGVRRGMRGRENQHVYTLYTFLNVKSGHRYGVGGGGSGLLHVFYTPNTHSTVCRWKLERVHSQHTLSFIHP